MVLGCFNRPWGAVELDRAFEGMAAAGFRHCGLLRRRREPILSPSSTPDELIDLTRRTEARGLKLDCSLVRVLLDETLDVAVRSLRAEIDHARAAAIPHLLMTGATDPARYEAFFSVVAAVAPYAAEHGVTLGLKPHGGISATNADCVAAVRRIGDAGFGIWYDPGNIIHYTGTDPEADLEAVAPYVVGMCVKDCVGGRGGTVSITPGDGEVKFDRVFAVLRERGFAGPALVECLGGETPEEVDAEARRVHESLLRWTGG